MLTLVAVSNAGMCHWPRFVNGVVCKSCGQTLVARRNVDDLSLDTDPDRRWTQIGVFPIRVFQVAGHYPVFAFMAG
jgi:hypothetical protein